MDKERLNQSLPLLKCLESCVQQTSQELLPLLKDRLYETLPLLKQLGSNLLGKTKELLPLLKQRVDDTLPLLIRYANISLEKARDEIEKANEAFPMLKELERKLPEKTRELLSLLKKRVDDTLPVLTEYMYTQWEKGKSEDLAVVKSCSGFLMEEIKEHPWGSALVVLIFFWFLTHKTGSLTKMMKAPEEGEKKDKEKMMKRPGEVGDLPRKEFEDDARGYFRDHRERKKAARALR